MTTKQVLTFDPAHFLTEAISDFLESGTQPPKIASAVIKVATGVELLLKDKLEKICPALILDKIDEFGLLVAKAFNLGTLMRNANELDAVEMKTASFNTLLNRASKFIDLGTARPHLEQLQKIRNSLVHHKGEVDMWQTNLLLVKHIFPFLEMMGKDDSQFQVRLDASLWHKIQRIERLSKDAFTSQLAKKIQHHSALADKLSKKEIATLIASEPDSRYGEIVDDSLVCPACRNPSLAAIGDVEVDYDEGVPTYAGWFVVMRCRVCRLRLNSSEAELIGDEYEEFFGTKDHKNKTAWHDAIATRDVGEYYE